MCDGRFILLVPFSRGKKITQKINLILLPEIGMLADVYVKHVSAE